MIDTKKSIDESIDACDDIIIDNERRIKFIQLLLVITLCFILMSIVLTTYFKENRSLYLNTYIELLKKEENKLDEILKTNEYYHSKLSEMHYKYHTQVKNDSSRIKDIKFILSALDSTYIANNNKDETLIRINKLTEQLPSLIKPDENVIMYILYGLFILTFGVLTSFYRYFLKERSKYEHYLIGFHRIRIAGNNSRTGYEDDVKRSLTQDAFTYEGNTSKNYSRKVDSPIPGYPTSDIATNIINKVLEGIEITTKPKST